MADKETILVTGVNGAWGARVAERLVAEAGGPFTENPRFHVLGIDAEPPETKIDGLDFIQADVRNPLLVELLREEAVSAVCHLVFQESHRPNESAFDLNVMGTMKLLGACAEAGVRKVVLKSSTAVYGALPSNVAFLTEEAPLKGSRAYGYTRDKVEIEAFCNGFRRQAPELMLTILRFPSIIGPDADTPMTRFLKEPLSPVLMGFDPRMQVIHEQDVIDALVHAVLNDVPGVFNVAAEGVLPLMRLLALAGKPPIPVFHLFAYWGVTALGGSGLRVAELTPIELDYIRYPWVADLARMREELGFTPRYTAEEVVREFAGHQRLRRYVPEAVSLAYDEERLRDTLERRRRMRGRQRLMLGTGEEETHE